MRAFLLPPDIRSGPLVVAAILSAALAPSPLAAQYPGELAGRVTDALSGNGIESALVEVVGAGRSTLTDGRGEFILRGLEPGRWTVRVSRLGYASAAQSITLQNGQRTRFDVTLVVLPVELRVIEATGKRNSDGAAIRITRAEIEESGARNVAEALEGRAGLLVESRGPGAAKTLSIRGSGDDDVLVLLDGAPLNGPITGSAELSSVPASQVESITVIKGAASARYGPGAQAGVVLIETRSAMEPTRLLLSSGSLGAWRAEADATLTPQPIALTAGFHAAGQDGRFEFGGVPLGSGSDTRRNADLLELGGFAAARTAVAGGRLRLRSGYTALERGLPGRSFLQSPHAREELDRWHAQAAWDRDWGTARIAAGAHALRQVARFTDPSPPVGVPYDSRTIARSAGGNLLLEIEPGRRLRSLHFGVDLRDQRYQASELAESAPGGRFDIGAFAGGRLAAGSAPWPELLATLRLDRDGDAGLWRVTHELTARTELGGVELHARHASSYNPPDFGDQYFKDGVAVKPNPELRAERVPSEIGLGAEVEGALPFALLGRLGVEAYRSDIRDMIIWAPDFRFVWSPRNFDVRRSGIDANARLSLPQRFLELDAAYTYARAVYDRPGDDAVQLIYRPRHSGSARLSWDPGPWDLLLEARYTGTRYPVPARVNALDSFWTFGFRAARVFRLGAWEARPALQVDRVLDNDDSLIFGFPEPGRTFRLEVALRRR